MSGGAVDDAAARLRGALGVQWARGVVRACMHSEWRITGGGLGCRVRRVTTAALAREPGRVKHSKRAVSA